METVPIDFIKDKNTQDLIKHIFFEGMGKPIEFDTAPTLATMDGNTWGHYSNSIYIKFSDGTGLILLGLPMS